MIYYYRDQKLDCKLRFMTAVITYLSNNTLNTFFNKKGLTNKIELTPTGVTKDMVYPVCGMMHIKEPLLLIGKSSICGGSGFPLYCPSGPLPYVQRHITVNEMC